MHRIIHLSLLMFVLSAVMRADVPAADRGELQAGFARVNITPQEPISMAGYAGVDHVSKGVSVEAMASPANMTESINVCIGHSMDTHRYLITCSLDVSACC